MTSQAGPTPFSANNSSAPAADHFAISPSNSINELSMFRGIYVGVTGDITIVSPANNAVLYKAVPQGIILPVCGIRVNSTATTASLLVGII